LQGGRGLARLSSPELTEATPPPRPRRPDDQLL